MLNKPQILLVFKKLPSFTITTKTLLCPSLNPCSRKPLQFLHLNQITNHNFFSFRSPPVKNKYTDDLALLHGFSKEQLADADEILNRYSSSRNLKNFNSGEVQSITSLLQQFASAYRAQGNFHKAYSYIEEAEKVYKLTNTNNTFSAAHNHFIKASLCLDLDDAAADIDYHLTEVDRICKLLGDDPEAKSLKIENLLTQAILHKRRNEEDKALELFHEIVKNRHQVIDELLPNLLIMAYEELGRIYASRKQVDDAVKYWKKGLELAIPHDGENSPQVAFLNCDIAEVLTQNQKPQEALPFAKKGLQVALKAYPSDHKEIGWCNYLLGNALLASGSPEKALEAYQKAIQIYEMQPQKDLFPLNDVYFQASNANHQLENSQEAFLLSKKSLELLVTSKDPDMMNICLGRIDELTENRRFEELEFYFKEALNACKNSTPQDKEKLAEINFLLGEFTFVEKQDPQNAFEFLKESERLYQKCSPDCQHVLFLVFSYLAQLNAHSKDYDECIRYLDKTAKVCKANEDYGYLQQVYYYLAKVYHQQGMTKKAEEAEEKFRNLLEGYDQEDPSIKDGVEHAKKMFSVLEKLGE